jgi:hypothetical protein
VKSPAVALFAFGLTAGALHADQPRGPAPKTDKTAAIEFCRQEALTRLKYSKTLEWTDNAKDEGDGQWFVGGVRDARSPAGEDVMQNFNCRVQKTKTGWRLRMVQVWKESSKTGRDVFLTWKE